MSERFYDYDPAEALDSAEAIEVFLADALETGDASYVAEAVEVAKRDVRGGPTLGFGSIAPQIPNREQWNRKRT